MDENGRISLALILRKNFKRKWILGKTLVFVVVDLWIFWYGLRQNEEGLLSLMTFLHQTVDALFINLVLLQLYLRKNNFISSPIVFSIRRLRIAEY
jgi:hypothetical protein